MTKKVESITNVHPTNSALVVTDWEKSRLENFERRANGPKPKPKSPHTVFDRDFKRSFKQANRGNYIKPEGKARYRVSVWIHEDKVWLDDMSFKWIEDAQVHAARWGRLYGYTVTQITREG